MTRGAGHMLSEKSQRTQNGTMFVDLDWPLNASRRLSASAELLVKHTVVAITNANMNSCMIYQNMSLLVTFSYEDVYSLQGRQQANNSSEKKKK